MSIDKLSRETILNSFSGIMDKYMKSFIGVVSEKYGTSESELMSLWLGQIEVKTEAKIKTKVSKPVTPISTVLNQGTPAEVDFSDLSIGRLNKCLKPELTALCKARMLKCTGNKTELIDRLLGKEIIPVQTSKISKGVVNPEKKETKGKKVILPTPPIISKISNENPVFAVRRNTHGNHEHPESRLVFNSKSQTVIGKQEDDGTVSELTDADIQICKKYKFSYDIPKNLDKKEDVNDAKVAELEESDVEFVKDEEDGVEEVLREDEEDDGIEDVEENDEEIE